MSARKPSVPAAGASSNRAMRRLSQSTGAGSGSQAPRNTAAATTRYWRALCDTNVFHAPFGRPVGDVEAGTVVEEGMRYVDVFDDLWVAVQAEDKSVAWLRRYATGALTELREPEWEPVVDAAARNVPADGAAEADYSPLDLSDNVMAHALGLVASDAIYMEYYWDRVHQASDRDWNHEFQSCIEDILYKFTRDEVDSRAALASFFSDFADEVQDIAGTIVKEMCSRLQDRTVKRHPSAVDVYLHRGILYRLCVDTSGGVYGGDKNASKVASQFHKAIHRILEIAPTMFISVPLVTMMTVNGYRILASTIPPVKANRMLVGPSAVNAQARVSASSAVPESLLNKLGATLSLKPHAYNASSASKTQPAITGRLPVDAQLFAGLDHRLYLLNVGRLFPPTAPSTRCPTYHPLTTPLFQRIRPEILARCHRELNPDAFFPDCSDAEANAEIATITQWIRDEGIPTVASILGMLEPVEYPEMESISCSSCAREVSNELRFVVCRCAENCSRICSHCFLECIKLETFEDNAAAAAVKLRDAAAKCKHSSVPNSTPRRLRGLLLEPDVTTLFHANCINMRYLSMVYNRLPESAAISTAIYLEIEMITRAAKHLLFQKLRVAQDVEQAHTVCVNFYLALLQPSGELAESFWANDLGPLVQAQFDIFTPFETSGMDTELVYRRVSELTGVELTDASVQSFATDEPFVQLKAIHPVMKLQHIPQYVEAVGGHQKALQGTLEDLLLFWIGQDQAQSEDERVRWDAKHPLYMKEKF